MLAFLRKGDDVQREYPPAGYSGRDRKPRVGLALGAGAARGWSHIGVIRECLEQDIVPDIVVGTSIGAVVGGCFAAGKLGQVEDFARSITRRSIFSMMDISFSGGGLLSGNRLRRRLERELAATAIETLPMRFAAVATEIGSGHEIWLTRGSLADAIRASYALPGIFEPVRLNGRWLFDGALVNPVPVTVCRAFGADVVIAVNLAETLGRGTVIQHTGPEEEELIEAAVVRSLAVPIEENAGAGNPLRTVLAGFGGLAMPSRRQLTNPANGAPGIVTVMADAFNIVQDRIARSRLAGDPPDVIITPKLGKIGLFDFHRADEMIALGRKAVRKAIAEIREIVSPA